MLTVQSASEACYGMIVMEHSLSDGLIVAIMDNGGAFIATNPKRGSLQVITHSQMAGDSCQEVGVPYR
ncbi:MAG: hypothetical protein WAM14_18960 [Candidatus Nitrosopolaris sp.]